MAVTAGQYTKQRNAGSLGDGPVGASIALYDLTMCFVDSTDGQLTNVVASGVNRFAGIVAQGGSDNSSGADGATDGQFYQTGEFLLTGSGFAATDVGKKVYASDNYTITESTEGTSNIGKITKYVSATQVWVLLDVVTAEGTTLVADPGDAGAIGAAVNDFYCEIVTAGAETRTLSNPLRGGITGVLSMRTDGGNGVITAATAINATGNNTITFADAGDAVVLKSVASGASAYKWVALTVDGGAALTTV